MSRKKEKKCKLFCFGVWFENLDTQNPAGIVPAQPLWVREKPRFFADDPAKISSITMLEIFAIRQ